LVSILFLFLIDLKNKWGAFVQVSYSAVSQLVIFLLSKRMKGEKWLLNT